MDRGVLSVVATPIGNLGDLSPRARETLGQVDLIAAEDTRHTRRLLRHFGIATPLVAFHEHNEREMGAALLHRLMAGEDIALVSDAGTPLISDPGYRLVRAARQAGLRVSPAPGPSALIAALSVAGLPSDRFVFEAFPPRTARQRREWLGAMAAERRTWIFYESSHRIAATLADLCEVVGEARELVVARELTKVHETLLGGAAREVLRRLEEDADQRKGEFVVLVRGAPSSTTDAASGEALRVLNILLADLPLKQAVALAARITGEKKNKLYKLALERPVSPPSP